MDRFVYIHGFNSGAESRSGRLLEQLHQQPVIRPQCNYSLPFAQCLDDMRRQISRQVSPSDRVCLMGSSLGGFYALNLRGPAICHVVAWNPVIYPAVQLEPFTGRNTYPMPAGRSPKITRRTLLSYAGAPDPRPWHNRVWREEQARDGGSGGRTAAPPPRDIYLGTHDELLNSPLARAYWQGAATLHDIDAGHSIADYSPAADVLKRGSVPCLEGWRPGGA